jgi:hypothetical protein
MRIRKPGAATIYPACNIVDPSGLPPVYSNIDVVEIIDVG